MNGGYYYDAYIEYAISTFFYILTIKNFMEVFFTEYKNKALLKLAYLSYPLLTVAALIMVGNFFAVAVSNLIAMFLIALCYKSYLNTKILAVGFAFAVMRITELIVLSLWQVKSMAELFETAAQSVTLPLIIITLLTFFVSVIAKQYKNLLRKGSFSSVLWISALFIPVASAYLATTIFALRDIVRTDVVIAFVAVIFLFNVFSFALHGSLSKTYDEKLQAELYKQEKEYYQNQCEFMQSTNENLKAYRHDMKNHLLMLSEIAENESEIKEYLSELIENLETATTYSSTGNIAFDSIINFKLNAAKEIGTEIKASVAVPDTLKMSIADIAVILGNLLDNAINAVSQIEEKRIHFNVRYDRGRVLINLENTHNGCVKYENGVIETTNTNKENHGFGIANVKKAVDKYNGIMKIFHSDDVFNTDIMLYAKCG